MGSEEVGSAIGHVMAIIVLIGLLVLIAIAPALIWGASWITGFAAGTITTLFLTLRVRVPVEKLPESMR
jgi:hypothetical protein